MRSEALIRLIFTLFLGWIPVTGATHAQSSAADPRIAAALAQLAAGDCQQAHQNLQQLIEATPATATATLTPALIANGKALSKLQQYAEALEQYERAIQIAAPGFDGGTLRLVAADAAFRSGQTIKSLRWSSEVLAQSEDPRQRLLATRIRIASQLSDDDIDDAWQSLQDVEAALQPQLSDLVTQIGATALTHTQPRLAEQAYQWLAERADSEKSQRQAELGIAWAAALGARPPAEAAAALRAFARQYPDDPDAVRALRAEAACWRQDGNRDKVYEALQTLAKATLGKPDAASRQMAIAAIDELSTFGDREPPSTLVDARKRIVLDGLLQADAPEARGSRYTDGEHLLVAAMRDAASSNDEAYWQAATEQAFLHARCPSIVAGALSELSAAGQDASAERLAATVLGRIETATTAERLSPSFAGACESACRWAADTGRWTMLALSADHVDADVAVQHLTPTGTRLLAEALMQTKRSQAAQQWFDAAVDAGAKDFAILIRRAELAVALDDLQTASEKLQAAADAVQPAQGPDGTLIEVLRAELAIRRARLEEARTILQRVVRLDQTDTQVRCRAQWLVGETFLLQRRYGEAVDAYRLVESFDTPAGNWTAVALVQAGKAFEQMGRPRDAAICYGGLLQRFADSEHALVARDRLAVIRDDTQRR